MALVVVDVRPATRRDLRLLEIAFPFGPPEQHAERLGRQERGKVVYLIAWNGEQPLGHGLLKWDGIDEASVQAVLRGTCPDVEDLFVLEAWRSQGIGTQILQAAEALVLERGFSRIGLSVELRNTPARRLYESLGFRDIGLDPIHEEGHFIDRDGKLQSWSGTTQYLVKPLSVPTKRG